MCKPNKVLHLNKLKSKQGLMDLRDIKAKMWSEGSLHEQITFLEKEERRKGRKSRVCKEEWLGLALLLISCSYKTTQHTRRVLRRFKVRKIKTLTSYFDLDFREKP